MSMSEMRAQPATQRKLLGSRRRKGQREMGEVEPRAGWTNMVRKDYHREASREAPARDPKKIEDVVQ